MGGVASGNVATKVLLLARTAQTLQIVEPPGGSSTGVTPLKK